MEYYIYQCFLFYFAVIMLWSLILSSFFIVINQIVTIH